MLLTDSKYQSETLIHVIYRLNIQQQLCLILHFFFFLKLYLPANYSLIRLVKSGFIFLLLKQSQRFN